MNRTSQSNELSSKINIAPAQRLVDLPAQFFAGLTRKAAQEIAQGHDVINLGQGNPDLPTPRHIVRSLQEAAENPKFHRYPPFNSYLFLKEAAALRYKEDYGVQLDPETEVAVLFGAKTGLVEISQCLLNPGDACLVPDPGYPDYLSGIAMSGAEMIPMPLRQSNGFLPDYRELSRDQLMRAKLMFVNYPSNPTGAAAPAAFYEETIRFAEKHGIVVASDFAYGAIGFDGKRPVSFLELPGAKEVGVEFYTLSKTYNMAGWRVGFALGNAQIIAMINLIQDHYYVSLFGGIQAAAATALTASQDCVRELVQTYESRRSVLYDAFGKIGWKAEKSQGSFFCWLPVPVEHTSTSLADLLLQRAKVVVAPGVGFGAHGEGYVRVGLLSTEERLKEAAERIDKLNLFG